MPLAQALSLEGWNVLMTGWRKSAAVRFTNGLYSQDYKPWGGHTAIDNLAFKTTATRPGLFEGLETYAQLTEGSYELMKNY